MSAQLGLNQGSGARGHGARDRKGFAIKRLIIVVAALVVALLAVFLTPKIAAQSKGQPELTAPQQAPETKQSENEKAPAEPTPPVPSQPAKPTTALKPLPAGTDTKGVVNAERLKEYLTSLGSPLAAHAEQIAASEFASTIIGICYIEQYRCTRAPYNNYWGIGGASGLRRYATLPDGIAAIDSLLTNYYNKRGKTTVESLNCYYVQPCSATWLSTVLRIKAHVESL